MYCHKCGKEIDDEAVVCIHCGMETRNMKAKDQPINIVNQSSSSSSAATKTIVRGRRVSLFDLIMIFCTGGLWLFWMLIRG